jgi:alpha-N-arabinofuranosidase
MTGIMEFAGIWKKRSQVFGTPSYYAFKMYAGTDIAKAVPAIAKSGTYSVEHGVNRLPQIASVPYLDVAAATSSDGKTLTLFCVNRSIATDIPAKIVLHDFAAAHDAKVNVLSSSSLADSNDEVSPDKVQPTERRETIGSEGWTHVFPHGSVTVISLKRK